MLALVFGDSVAHFITINVQSQSNRDCCFQSSSAYFVSKRSYQAMCSQKKTENEDQDQDQIDKFP